MKLQKVIPTLVSYLFILLFVYVGTTKFLEGDMFYNNIRNSPILGGKTMALLGSWLVPFSELAIALLIAWPKTRVKGLYGALGLMSLFTGYTVAILFFAPYVPCSCGGVISLLSWEQHLVFNTVFLLLAVFGIGLSQKEKRMGKGVESMQI